jgi:hypothetical protein
MFLPGFLRVFQISVGGGVLKILFDLLEFVV